MAPGVASWKRALGAGEPDWKTSRSIVFASGRGGAGAEIFLINPDGSALRQLTRDQASDDSPSWSPDVRGIAFTSNRDGNQEIYVMNANGSGQTRLTNSPAADFEPSWGR
ncbi:MAG: hypothetical protein JWN98_1627 [Abditibacteriota bacterium]|nr:hypothetical protein [Abditibacteriota bacterium]